MGSIRVTPVIEAEDDDFAVLPVDAIKDAVGAVSGRPDAGQILAQFLAGPALVGDQGGSDEVDNCCCHCLGQIVRDSPSLNTEMVSSSCSRSEVLRLRRGRGGMGARAYPGLRLASDSAAPKPTPPTQEPSRPTSAAWNCSRNTTPRSDCAKFDASGAISRVAIAPVPEYDREPTGDALNQTCPDCQPPPGEGCHWACSSWWA
jgi:hypothetical protein